MSSSPPAASPPAACATEPRPATLVDCAAGFGANITSGQCAARGCCFSADAPSQQRCTYVAGGVPVETVHIIPSNHFDAGYASLTADVVSRYFTEFFPRAAKVGALYGKPLRWLTHSYLISLFLDCPRGMGLACPSEAAKAELVAAVRAGHITWHALPFNAELALGSLPFGVGLSHDLDARFGLPPKVTGSTRDVPGMTRVREEESNPRPFVRRLPTPS